MRFAFVPFIVILGATCAAGEETSLPTLPRLDDGRYGYQEVVTIEGAEAEELQSRARSWVAQSYGSAQAVIQLDDTVAGSLVVKGNFSIPYMGGLNTVPIYHTLTIEAKAGRYRYTLSDFLYSIPKVPMEDEKRLAGNWIMTKAGREKTRGRIAAAAEATIVSLKTAMQMPSPAKSNW